MRDSCKTFRRAHLLQQASFDGPHPGGCVECRRFVEDERNIVGFLRAHRPTWEAPPSLRERVATRLEGEHARLHRPKRGRRAFVYSAFAVPLIAAAALVLVWPRSPDARRRAEATTALVVRDYLEYARRDDKVQHASGSPAELKAWFERDVQLATLIPDLPDAHLLGGRHCNLGGRPAALTFYELSGPPGRPPETVSLFVFESRGDDWSGMQPIRGRVGKRAREHRPSRAWRLSPGRSVRLPRARRAPARRSSRAWRLSPGRSVASFCALAAAVDASSLAGLAPVVP